MNYICPKCKTTHSEEIWDEATRKCYGYNITYIKDGGWDNFYRCPNCGEDSGYEQLMESAKDTITITKQEYEELLEFKAMYEGLCK